MNWHILKDRLTQEKCKEKDIFAKREITIAFFLNPFLINSSIVTIVFLLFWLFQFWQDLLYDSESAAFHLISFMLKKTR
jgi:hypothetical protein